MKTVYLAGPITGLNYAGVTDWRNYTIRRLALAEAGIKGLSPMRGKEYLSEVSKFTADGDKYKPLGVLSSNRGTITRDRWDATRCDMLLVNFLGAKVVSIGTIMEIAWADSKRIPIVCAIEEEGNPHEHGMLMECLGYRVPDLDMAIELVKSVLG